MNKHPELLFQKRNFSPPGMINFANIFITPPKTFQFDLGVTGKEILTLSALYRSCQFLPLSDRTILPYTYLVIFYSGYLHQQGFSQNQNLLSEAKNKMHQLYSFRS